MMKNTFEEILWDAFSGCLDMQAASQAPQEPLQSQLSLKLRALIYWPCLEIFEYTRKSRSFKTFPNSFEPKVKAISVLGEKGGGASREDLVFCNDVNFGKRLWYWLSSQGLCSAGPEDRTLLLKTWKIQVFAGRGKWRSRIACQGFRADQFS